MMGLVGKVASLAGMNSGARHSEALKGMNIHFGATLHKVMSMYSEALPTRAATVDMGLRAAAAAVACLCSAVAHLHSTDWKNQAGMASMCFGLVVADRHSLGWNSVELALMRSDSTAVAEL